MFKKLSCCLLLGFVTVCCLATPGLALDWDNFSTDSLWSTGTNWDPNIAGFPATTDTVIFKDTGTAGAAGTVTNIVDGNVTVASLRYENLANFHTTQINSGNTLTVNAGHFFVGPGGTAAAATNVTIQGDTPGVGTLTFNAPSFDFVVGRPVSPAFNGPQNSVLDASDLGTLNITANQLDVGRVNPNGSGVFTMADSNNVTVDQIRVGGWNNSGSIYLGTTNVINVDSIELGWQIENQGSGQSRLEFASGLTSPTVTIRDKAGTGRAGFLAGWGSNGAATGIMDLSGGTADVMLSTAVLGQPRGITCCASNGVGSITFDAGVVDATTLVLGRSLLSSNAGAFGSGYMYVNGGTLIADSIQLGDSLGPSTARGYLNIAGGTVEATAIEAGPGTGTGGTVRELNFTSGTLSHKTGTDLDVTADIDFKLIGNSSKQVFADTGRTVTIDADIVDFGAGPIAGLTKTGDGTLLLNGTNAYTGDTLVSAGTLGGNGTLANTVTVGSGAMLAPGESAGSLTVGAADLQAGSTLQIELGGTTPGVGGYDQLVVTGNASLAGELEVILLPGFSLDNSDVFTIIDAGSIDGMFSNAITSVGLANSIGYFEVNYSGGFVTLSNFQVPEPSSLCLLGLGCVLLAKRRRRQDAARA